MTDRRYGINKYGDGKLYGPSDVDNSLSWGVSIDWDGTFVNESERLMSMNITRGREALIRPKGEGFEPINTGTAVITLDNNDGRYDAWNTLSPLYPNVNYGKNVVIKVRDRSVSNAIYPLMVGTIVDIVPVDQGTNAKVILYVNDGLDYLRNNNARVALLQDITPDTAIGHILNDVNWPWDRELDVSTDNIDYWWSSGNKIAMDELQDLAVSFLGYFFADNEGKARFIIRTSSLDAIGDYPQDSLLKDIGNPQPYQIQRNVTRIKVHPRTAASTGTIWQFLGTSPSILNNTSLTLFANYTYNNIPVPAKSVITPVATTDWLVNSQADGSGSNLTGSCTLSFTDFGDTAKIVITNSSGSTGYVTLLKIRGDAIYENNAADVTYPTNVDTVLNKRELTFDLVWQQDVNVAADLASVLGPFYDALHPMPVIKIENRPSLQFTPDLFDIVTATIPKLGILGDAFRVGGIKHESLTEGCQAMLTTLSLEPYVSAENFWVWDTFSEFDTQTVFGY